MPYDRWNGVSALSSWCIASRTFSRTYGNKTCICLGSIEKPVQKYGRLSYAAPQKRTQQAELRFPEDNASKTASERNVQNQDKTAKLTYLTILGVHNSAVHSYFSYSSAYMPRITRVQFVAQLFVESSAEIVPALSVSTFIKSSPNGLSHSLNFFAAALKHHAFVDHDTLAHP